MAEETLDKAEKPYSAPWWLAQITRYEKDFEQWQRAGEKLIKLYARQKETNDVRRFAMLYANTEVLKPSIYSRPPVPQVSRRFKDRDPIGRKAAELLERSSSYELERQNIDATLRSCRDDLVLPGRGQVWIRYKAEIDEETQEIEGETVPVDYVNWRDFGHLPARVWAEVPAVWRAVYYDKSEAEREFNKDVAEKLSYSHKPKGGDDSDKKDTNARAKAKCYEIWCRTTRKQYIVSKEVDDFLRPEGPPPLDFENFYPCPKPVYSLVTTDNLIPTPDYKHYQDQAQEIDDLTARIGKLTDALKLVGFYPSGAGDTSTAIEKAMDSSVENKLIPIESWATFSEHGGSNAIVWLPIKDVADTIRACVELRTQLIQDVYQISGISDILRGATDPNETASAQQLKSQWGSVRIKDRQQGMADFARDITRLVCEVIAERFEPQRVMQMANMELGEPPQPQPPQQGMPPQPDPAMMEYQKKADEFKQAFELLKDEKLRGFRIDIETDSTIQPDEDAEKQRINEFLTAVGGFMEQAFPIVQAAPELLPMMSEVLLLTVRRYRAGRSVEDAIEQSMEAMQNKIKQAAANPKPDPEMAKVEAEKAKGEAQIQVANKKADADIAIAEKKANADIQLKERTSAIQAQQAANQQQQDMVLQTQQGEMDNTLARDQMANEAAMQEQQESKEDKMVVQRLDALTAMVQQLIQANQPQPMA